MTTNITATEALRKAGFVHANRGPNAAHDIYSIATGEIVARLHANEVWGWLKLRAELKRLEKQSATLAERRFSMPPGSSRARVTSANARWARVAEARDRVANQLADMEASR